MKKIEFYKGQLLVTPEQYRFLYKTYEELGIYPSNIISNKHWFDNGFELVFKGMGISPEHKNGFTAIDLRQLGNDFSTWIKEFYKHCYGDGTISEEVVVFPA